MITRIVRMTFRNEKRKEFVDFFNRNKTNIMEFDGCHAVDLYGDESDENVFFTISKWEDLDALEKYRSSEFFKRTWSTTKSLFSERAEAWSLSRI